MELKLVYTVDFTTQKKINMLKLAYGWSESRVFK